MKASFYATKPTGSLCSCGLFFRGRSGGSCRINLKMLVIIRRSHKGH